MAFCAAAASFRKKRIKKRSIVQQRSKAGVDLYFPLGLRGQSPIACFF